MIAAVRRHAEQHGITHAEFSHEDFRSLSLEEGSMDAAISMYALHHIPDVEKAIVFETLYHAMRPGSLFYLEDDTFNFSPEEYKRRVPEIYAEWKSQFGDEAWQYLKDKLAGDDFEYTPYWHNLKRIISDSGYTIIEHRAHGLDGISLLLKRPSR